MKITYLVKRLKLIIFNTWADIINHANLGMEVMHERNAHNFPIYLATIEAATNG